MKLLLCLILQLATKSAAIHASTQGLDTVDSMAFSAMRFCELSTANPNRGQGNSDLVAALVADGTSIAGLESDIRVPDGEKVNMYSNDFSSQHWEELYRTLCDFHVIETTVLVVVSYQEVSQAPASAFATGDSRAW